MCNHDLCKWVTGGPKEAYDNISGIHFVISRETQSSRLCFHVNVCKHFLSLVYPVVDGLVSQIQSSKDLILLDIGQGFHNSPFPFFTSCRLV